VKLRTKLLIWISRRPWVNNNRALAILGQADPADKASPSLLLQVAYRLIQADRPLEAIEKLDQAIARAPSIGVLHEYLAVAQYKLGRFNDAIDSFNRAFRMDPQIRKKPYRLHEFVRSNGRAERWNEALAAARELAALDPKQPIAWDELGWAYENLGQFSEAIDAFRRAVELGSTDDGVFLRLGHAYQSQGDWKMAAESYQRGLERSPNDAELQGRAALATMASGDTDKGIRLVERALELDPNNFSLLMCLGVGCERLKMVPRAAEVFERAAMLHPEDTESRSHLVSCYAAQNRFEEAYKLGRECVRRAPDDALAHASLTYAFVAGKRYEEAIEIGRRTLELEPDQFETQVNIGEACLRLDRFSEAIAWLESGAKLINRSPELYSLLAEAQLRAGDLESAQRSRDNAVRLDPLRAGFLAKIFSEHTNSVSVSASQREGSENDLDTERS
jgi:tetratricopeptide (TPR) repeat protein